MIYGYARLSIDAEDLAGQLAQLKAAVCEKSRARIPTARNPDGGNDRARPQKIEQEGQERIPRLAARFAKEQTDIRDDIRATEEVLAWRCQSKFSGQSRLC